MSTALAVLLGAFSGTAASNAVALWVLLAAERRDRRRGS